MEQNTIAVILKLIEIKRQIIKCRIHDTQFPPVHQKCRMHQGVDLVLLSATEYGNCDLTPESSISNERKY